MLATDAQASYTMHGIYRQLTVYLCAAAQSCACLPAQSVCASRPAMLEADLEDVCAEAFVVCQNYRRPAEFEPAHLRALLDNATASYLASPLPTLAQRQLVPFIACGDLSGWDADQSYDLPREGYVSLPPVAPPTAPAYKLAKERQLQQKQQLSSDLAAERT